VASCFFLLALFFLFILIVALTTAATFFLSFFFTFSFYLKSNTKDKTSITDQSICRNVHSRALDYYTMEYYYYDDDDYEEQQSAQKKEKAPSKQKQQKKRDAEDEDGSNDDENGEDFAGLVPRQVGGNKTNDQDNNLDAEKRKCSFLFRILTR
jgi:hypothetical protein